MASRVQLVFNQVLDRVFESAGLELSMEIDNHHGMLIIVIGLETRHANGSMLGKRYLSDRRGEFFYRLNANIKRRP